MTTAFVNEMKNRREAARKCMMDGAVTEDYTGERETIIKILNQSLATELVCVLRYKSHYFTATGRGAILASQEFLEHAGEEQEHADKLATRIVQLGGEPEMDPANLSSLSHSDYHSGGSTMEKLEEDLIAERIAVTAYREAIQFIGDKDPTTRRLLEDILAQEEEHADDLADLIENIAA